MESNYFRHAPARSADDIVVDPLGRFAVGVVALVHGVVFLPGKAM